MRAERTAMAAAAHPSPRPPRPWLAVRPHLDGPGARVPRGRLLPGAGRLAGHAALGSGLGEGEHGCRWVDGKERRESCALNHKLRCLMCTKAAPHARARPPPTASRPPVRRAARAALLSAALPLGALLQPAGGTSKQRDPGGGRVLGSPLCLVRPPRLKPWQCLPAVPASLTLGGPHMGGRSAHRGASSTARVHHSPMPPHARGVLRLRG